MDDIVREFDELMPQEKCPLSRLYHQNSSLGKHSIKQFSENIVQYSNDIEALKRSMQARKEYKEKPRIQLPPCKKSGWKSLKRILMDRRTRRGQFSGKSISLSEIGNLLGLGAGLSGIITHPVFDGLVQLLRTWPSGGAMYPLELYWGALQHDKTLEKALYHYQPHDHVLEKIAKLPDFNELSKIIYAEGLWQGASALVVISAVWSRTQIKYGERGYRFIMIDAGHLCQNLLLVSEDLGLNAIPLGGFDDEGVAKMLNLNSAEEGPVYAVIIGKQP